MIKRRNNIPGRSDSYCKRPETEKQIYSVLENKIKRGWESGEERIR